jgi:hypothetical protein
MLGYLGALRECRKQVIRERPLIARSGQTTCRWSGVLKSSPSAAALISGGRFMTASPTPA